MTEPLERIQRAVDAERVRFDLKGALEELNVADLRELIDAAEDLCTAVEAAEEEIETWHDEDEKEARAEARDGALEALQEVLDKAEDLSVWLEWPNATEAAQEARMAAEVDAELSRAQALARDEQRRQTNLDWIAQASLEDLDKVTIHIDDQAEHEAITARRTELENP